MGNPPATCDEKPGNIDYIKLPNRVTRRLLSKIRADTALTALKGAIFSMELDCCNAEAV